MKVLDKGRSEFASVLRLRESHFQRIGHRYDFAVEETYYLQWLLMAQNDYLEGSKASEFTSRSVVGRVRVCDST